MNDMFQDIIDGFFPEVSQNNNSSSEINEPKEETKNE